MSKYDRLRDYLNQNGQACITMTFAQIEAVLQDTLPPTAYRRVQWWANSGHNERDRHVQAKAWYCAGYDVQELNLADRKVTFRRR